MQVVKCPEMNLFADSICPICDVGRKILNLAIRNQFYEDREFLINAAYP